MHLHLLIAVTAPSHPWRRALVIGSALAACSTIALVFWLYDLRYSLPTDRPAGLVQPRRGDALAVPPALRSAGVRTDLPLLVHFYNPECPCSRFNRDHLHALAKRFRDRVQFVAVVEREPTSGAGEHGLPMPHVVDDGGAIARAFGVYATPQAVLLDVRRRLVFRGNYNTSRYCTTRETEFVRLAIEALLAGHEAATDVDAEIAYGCALPCDTSAEAAR